MASLSRQVLEHSIRHISTFVGAFFPLVIGMFLLLIDRYWGAALNRAETVALMFTQLSGVVNVLVSVLIGIVLTTFSVIFVVMQLASSQFSPRILRYFLSNDLKVQQFIGLFIGTIALCLIPQVAAIFAQMPFMITLSVGVIFAFYCLVWAYPRMVAYLADNMNASSITRRIKNATVDVVTDLYRDNWKPGDRLLYKRCHTNREKQAIGILSPFESGYLENINYAVWSKMTTDFLTNNQDLPALLFYQKPIIGEFILRQTSVLITIQPDADLTPEQKQRAILAGEAMAKAAFSINKFRSYTQDVNYGVRKLVDMGIKAISPAINDPTTCINCIDYLGEIVRELGVRQFPSTEARQLALDRIVVNEFGFDELVDFSFDQIYQWGKHDPTIVKRILRTKKQIIPTFINPYHLYVLLLGVDEMELGLVYSPEKNAVSMQFTREQLRSLHQEWSDFEEKARRQIDRLEKEGILARYALQTDESIASIAEIRLEEVRAVDYLRSKIA